MKIPSVARYMTAPTHTIGPDQTLTAAHHLMRDHRIRHLPVVRGHALVGLVSQRDLHLMETLKDVDPDAVTVDAAMSPDVVTVSPDAPLDEVAATMMERKLGSVVVVHHDRIAGIFTTTDALRALAQLLRGA